MKKELKSKIILEKSKKIAQACRGDACAICVKDCLMLDESMQSPKSFFNSYIENQMIDPLLPFSCTQCGHCEKICPETIKVYEIFDEMKKELQRISGSRPVLKSHYSVYFHQRISRTKLVKGSSKGEYRRAFMPGCSLSAYSPILVEKTFEYLKSIDSTIGSITNCCNKPLQDLGHENSFKYQMNRFIEEISVKGIDEIIVGCQNCYDTIRKEYPEIKVKTLWHIFDKEGLPKTLKESELLKKSFAIHDPCPVENTPEIKHIIRRLINKLGCKIENDNVVSYTKCCGLGAMAGVSNASLAKKVTNQRIKDLNNKRIINYCAACTEVMGQGNQKSYHLLELIFDTPVNREKSTLKKWLNRCKTKQKIT
jgi:Fe-S oxidoreductase